MSISGKLDTSQWDALLNKLGGPIKTSLARSMAVAGGDVLRDEAKLLAPLGTEEGGSIHPGALRNAIYLAYKPGRSTGSQIVYSVSWNSKKAPHGHLVEFGHWQTNPVAKIPGGYGGGYYSTKNKLPTPKWIPAHPFLRPTLTSAGARAQEAMVRRGRERLSELLRGAYTPPDEDFV